MIPATSNHQHPVFPEHRQHFFRGIFMQENGGCLTRLARACACLHPTILKEKIDLNSMPYKERARTSWRLWLQQVRGNNQDQRQCKR